MPSFWPLLLLLVPPLSLTCYGLFPSRVIDDTLGDPLSNVKPLYFPPDAWIPSPSSCPWPPDQCPPNLNPARMSNGTWHSNIFASNDSAGTLPRAEVSFSGSAVSVHCAISFYNVPRIYQTLLSFYLDGEKVGQFATTAAEGTGIAYNTLVYANDTLPLGTHNLTIVNGKTDGKWYLMILDDIQYTADLPNTPIFATSGSASNTSSKDKVLTGVLITVCLLFGTVLAYLFYRWYRSRRPKPLTKSDIGILPTSTAQANKPSVREWITQYLGLNASKRSINFNSALFVTGRPRLQSESTKDASVQRQYQAIFEDELDAHSKKSMPEGRWAFITSWRDRAVREAEMPSLPPTSHAPTTVVSGPSLPQHQSQRPQQQQQETQRTARRCFTVMNT